MKLYEKIIENAEQGLEFYATLNDTVREQNMIKNFREILNDTKGRKIFAIMGWVHADQKGTDTEGPPIGFTMASVLKNEVRLASIVLRQQSYPDRWQYNITINESLKTTPYNSPYNGDWPGHTHFPSITQLVVGIRLIDADNGEQEKTVFNVGDHFYYGFYASDPKGDMYILGSAGTYELKWHIEDRAGNKSNVITRTITVN